jgi:hypothetical protein
MNKPHITYSEFGTVLLHIDYGTVLEFESLEQLIFFAKHILKLAKDSNA